MITPTQFPTIDEFLKLCPLPPELAHMESEIRTPQGQSLMQSIMGAYAQGLRGAALDNVYSMVLEFYSKDTHRCTTCLCWTKHFSAGAIIDDAFHLVVICNRCAKLIDRGRGTPTMKRNLQSYGGSE